MNLPNKLTLLRIALIPLFCIFLCVESWMGQLVAALIFILASLTDMLDGYIARRDQLITDFGKLVDPIADKMLITSAMIFMVAQGRMTAIVVLLFISREFIISAFRMLAASRGTVIAADKLGKFKTVAQMIAIVMLILFKPLGDNRPLIGNVGIIVSDVAVYIALTLSIVSCIDYVYKNRSIINRQM